MSGYGVDPDAGAILANAIRQSRYFIGQARASAARISIAPDPNNPPGLVDAVETNLDQLRGILFWLEPAMELFATETSVAFTAYEWVDSFVAGVFEKGRVAVGDAVGRGLRVLLVGAALSPGGIIFGALIASPTVRQKAQQLLAPFAPVLDAISKQLEAIFGPMIEDFVEWLLTTPEGVDFGRDAFDFITGLVNGLTIGPSPVLADDDVQAARLATLVLLLSTVASKNADQLLVPGMVQHRHTEENRALEHGPATGYLDAFEQITEQKDDIVIREWLLADGTTRYQVFMQGTESWGMGDGKSAMDMLGNVGNVAHGGAAAGSAAALYLALREAGVPEDAPIDMFGYSQGGHAVMNVVNTGHYNVVSTTTYGAPFADGHMPPDAGHVQIQLDADPVANIFGGTERGPNTRTIELPANLAADAELFDGHLPPAYIEALEQLEASGDTLAMYQAQERVDAYEGATLVNTYTYGVRR